jgi:heme-degrading monooxygenase HmoA
MIAVIFEVWPAPGQQQAYLDHAAALRSELERIDGFLSVERFQSLTEPGKMLSLSFWRDEAAVAAWRNHARHREVQAAGRSGVFKDYRLRVAGVVRDYGLSQNRAAAPLDSRRAHEDHDGGAPGRGSRKP